METFIECSAAARDDIENSKRALQVLAAQWQRESGENARGWLSRHFARMCRANLPAFSTAPALQNAVQCNISWHCAAKALNTDDAYFVLDECALIETSWREHGEHGCILALGCAEYDGASRVSGFALDQIVFLVLNAASVTNLAILQSPHSANERANSEKYFLNLDACDEFIVDHLVFAAD